MRGSIPFYIMTSQHTHDKIVSFFQDNAFFGLDAANVLFFRQVRFCSCGFPFIRAGQGLARHCFARIFFAPARAFIMSLHMNSFVASLRVRHFLSPNTAVSFG